MKTRLFSWFALGMVLTAPLARVEEEGSEDLQAVSDSTEVSDEADTAAVAEVSRHAEEEHRRADGVVFIDPRISTDGRDLQTGLRAGAEQFLGRLRLQAMLDVEFWPLPNGTRVRVAETEEHFIQDAWYTVGPALGLAWPVAPWAEANAASGLSRAVGGQGQDGWAGWLDFGLRFPATDDMNWGLYYQYHPRGNVRDHRVALQLRLKAI